jgi:hypothetical protein
MKENSHQNIKYIHYNKTSGIFIQYGKKDRQNSFKGRKKKADEGETSDSLYDEANSQQNQKKNR